MAITNLLNLELDMNDDIQIDSIQCDNCEYGEMTFNESFQAWECDECDSVMEACKNE